MRIYKNLHNDRISGLAEVRTVRLLRYWFSIRNYVTRGRYLSESLFYAIWRPSSILRWVWDEISDLVDVISYGKNGSGSVNNTLVTTWLQQMADYVNTPFLQMILYNRKKQLKK